MRLIDADALVAKLEADAEEMEEPIAKMFTYAAINDVKHAPTVDAVPVKHGRWKIKTVREYDLSYGGRIYIPEYVCGCCGHYYESYVRGDEPIMPEDADFPMYCEQCGARMDGDDNGKT